MRFKPALVILAAAAVAGATPAAAACKKFGFEVNDYGKDGPTKDAKDLLDKHIATWAKEKGIKTYTTGKKDVTCELFLNFIVFDEHTCKATATVCWQGADPSPGSTEPTAAKPAAKPAPKAKAKAAEAPAAKQ
jgi:hypothetical protein